MTRATKIWKFFLVAAIGLTTTTSAHVERAVADDPLPTPAEKATEAKATNAVIDGDGPPLPGLKPLSPGGQIWLDPAGKQIVMRGQIVLRRGPLELFACLKNTKEHEAIVAVETKAYVVHAGLLACGALPGNPASFLPEFVPAKGSKIEIVVEWTDAAGKRRRADARDWVRDAKNGEALKYPWVFGGSGFWTDPKDGKKYYQAEDGDFICISNFPSAMLDLPVESSAANAALMFEAFTDRIPPEKTKVLVFLKPKVAAKAPDAKPADQKPAAHARPPATDGDFPAPPARSR